ncbi:LacI family DNA-binding transcriptional regulator [Pantoea agglomerans]|uniref:LacI family DNA-binding transcriptional regulator n=1 Tax=Enterobacter agglomerans TaxID=549 RepID=UPI0013BD053D|nr:LacI family DNA-binding transcriptional regulator [Pantoea agglomerans]MDQ0432353.1 DNA-binding LacI/PurR family transcriptional regulator [Pantoea agglomerans]NEG86508.1 LacI family DNA-binding transcriptional regulator [Pantoea agglomerans]NEH08666.1 LacI family DNA-binding transcriptional regulator [Pantoea agglomerans]
MTSRSVTLDDVAQLAGVSYQTVSRVLNRSEQVSARTRERVEAAMLQLNYVPNRVAQQLAGKATRTLGLATSDLALMAPAQIASAIQQRAAGAGYHLVIAMDSGNDAAATVNELLAQRVDGLLINLPLEADEAQQIQLLCGSKPVLFLDVEPQAAVAQCQYPNESGARAAVEHLVALGHRQIGLLNGPLRSVSARQRENAWRQALADHQLTPHCSLRGDWSAQSGYQALLAQLPDDLPQALLVANDQMALGAMRALHQYGVAIPGEISVIGYDDTAESAWYQPPLTTVRQDLHSLGAQSVERMLARLQGAEASDNALETTLVIRETTAPPADERINLVALSQQLQVIARRLAGK